LKLKTFCKNEFLSAKSLIDIIITPILKKITLKNTWKILCIF